MIKLKVKLIGVTWPEHVPGQGIERDIILEDGQTLEHLEQSLKLPARNGYSLLVEGTPIATHDRDSYQLQNNQKITVFPLIKGG